MLPYPDPNRNAPRPSSKADMDDPRPDMDHPPAARAEDQPAFDRAVAAADADAREGSLTGNQNPTPPDTGRDDQRGTLDRDRVRRGVQE